MKPTFKQLTAFLETTESKLDLTDFSKCIAYLYDSEGGEIASSDFENEIHLCNDTIWIGDDEYTLSDVQKDLVLEYLNDEIQDDLQTWNEMKNDTYNVRDDQY